MANYSEKINIFSSTNFVSVSSRYINSQLYYYGDDKKITFETYKRQDIQQFSDDKFLEITRPLNFRPDLVSNKFYGSPDFWWKIMQYNGIADVYDFRQGRVIRLPAAIDLLR